MFVGAGGWPGAVALATMLVGLALACGGASALNHVIDRDIDRLMGSRTAARPVASAAFPPRARSSSRLVTLGALVRAARLGRERS
jgi:heme O synthase-like polyprenyltransferase